MGHEFQSGAEPKLPLRGEQEVADLLRALPPLFTVLHDLQVPGSRANIDHLVIGPTGVFVVDAKRYSQPLRVSDGMVWRGRYPIRREVETVAWEAEQAARVLQVPVYSMLCFIGSALPVPVVDLPPVRVTTGGSLVPAVLSAPQQYGIDDISRLTLRGQRGLPSTGTPVARPPSRRPQRPAAAPASVRRPAPARRSARARGRNRGRRRQEPPIAVLIALLIGLLVAGPRLPALLDGAMRGWLGGMDAPAAPPAPSG